MKASWWGRVRPDAPAVSSLALTEMIWNVTEYSDKQCALAVGGFAGDINAAGLYYDTPLVMALDAGRVRTIAALAARGDTDANLANHVGYRPISCVTAASSLATLRAFLDAFPSVDVNLVVSAHDGTTALHAIDHVEGATLLLDRGADVTIRDKAGRTAVDAARAWQCAELTQLLTRAGDRRAWMSACAHIRLGARVGITDTSLLLPVVLRECVAAGSGNDDAYHETSEYALMVALFL